MNLASQIYTRKSCRDYLDEEIDVNVIENIIADAELLDNSFKYRYEIFKKNEVNIKTRWRAPYYLALFCEDNPINRVNLGFVFQQVCLHMQSIGIGNCWVGMASLKEKDSEFIICISFGKSNDMTRDISSFKRKKLNEISDFEDERLIPAQLAPSAINMQPWYFKHNDDGFDVYQQKQNIIKRQFVKKWNSIDVGIALSHLYVENENTFQFYVKTDFQKIKGYIYIGSIKI